MRIRYAGRLIGLAILLFLVIGGLQTPHVQATGGLALDGSGFGSRIGINSCVLSQNLTTTQQPDVIVALVAINDTTTTVTSPTDTASLHWTYRASQQGLADVQIFFYYAISSQVLAADNITFGLSSLHVATICETFGISGADTNIPFDPNSGMPSTNGGNSTTNSVTYNTYNPNDFLIILQGFCAVGSAGSGSPSRSGFIPIVGAERTHVSSNNCADFLQTNTYYEIVSTTQSSNTVSWPFDVEDSSFAIIGDAIQSTPGPLSASVVAGSNAVDVGQIASFSCTGTGGVYPYIYSWTFGDGSTGSGASTSHAYYTPGTVTVVCTARDQLGTLANRATQMFVISDPSITSFSAASTSLSAGEKATFSVSASGGYGPLTYSYANLPAGCISANVTTISCTPTSSGNYQITATVTDRLGGSATSTLSITVDPQRILGLPQVIGIAVIFGAIVGVGAIVTLSVTLALRRKKRRQV